MSRLKVERKPGIPRNRFNRGRWCKSSSRTHVRSGSDLYTSKLNRYKTLYIARDTASLNPLLHSQLVAEGKRNDNGSDKLYISRERTRSFSPTGLETRRVGSTLKSKDFNDAN